MTGPAWLPAPGQAAEMECLSRGESVPGGTGACARDSCAHSKPWHTPDDPRRPCEQCPCEAFQEKPGTDAFRHKPPGRATTQGLSGSRVAPCPARTEAAS